MIYLTDHKLVNTRHHGILQKKSCATCMADGLDSMPAAADARKSVKVIHLDIIKSFDETSHRRLIDKTEALAITDPNFPSFR